MIRARPGPERVGSDRNLRPRAIAFAYSGGGRGADRPIGRATVMTTGTGSAGGVEWRNLAGSKRHRRTAAIARRSTSWRTPRRRHADFTSPRSSMRISAITNPSRPATSSPDRSGAASTIFLGTSASHPTRQARGASMWHGGGVRVAIGGSAGPRAGSEHPRSSANASHMPRHAFGPTWGWTPNRGDWPQDGQGAGRLGAGAVLGAMRRRPRPLEASRYSRHRNLLSRIVPAPVRR